MLLTALSVVVPAAMSAAGTGDVTRALRSMGCFRATVGYEVLMSLQDDVAYTVQLESMATPADTLSPCDYLIEWTADRDGDTAATGFAAYSRGDAYMYRGDRLLEYHYAEDQAPFDRRSTGGGVQRRAQFASLLPGFIADEIDGWTGDDRWRVEFAPDTVVDGSHVAMVRGVMSLNGDVGREVIHTFDTADYRPLSTRIESNPGALAEQTILATYRYDTAAPPCEPINEAMLRDRYADQFDTLRDSNFAISNLRGRDMMQFALLTPTAERYTYHRGDGFRTSTLLVLLDPAAEFTPSLISTVRDAVDLLPANVDVIWAFTSNSADDIDAAIERPRPGEHILMGARTLARDCGATLLPTIMFLRRDGVIADFHQGYGNSLKDVVIEKSIGL